MTHSHFASYTVRHNTSMYITLYFSGPGVSTQQGEGQWRPTHTLSIQCFTHTKSKQHLVKGCTNFPKIWEPLQNCISQNDEQIKFHAENPQQLSKPTWKLAYHVFHTRAALMSFVRIPVLVGLYAHITPTGLSLHTTRPVYPNLTLYILRATTSHT